MDQRKKTAGLARSAGYQVGARRTLPVSLGEAWDLVISRKGLRAWLGGAPRAPLLAGEAYHLSDGTQGAVRVFCPASHLRLTWRPPGWANPSLIQVRVIPAANGTTVSFHQEHLPDARRREERRLHFRAALEELERAARRT